MCASISEEKMLTLQKQMRESQADLGDFLHDMDKWETEVKKKDEVLKKGKPTEQTKLPPVRNSLDKKKRKKKGKPPGSGEDEKKRKEKKKLSGYDFRAWDKLDYDKLCEEADDEKQSAESSEYETDEEWEVERKEQQALLEKDRGNEFFKKEDYANAIEAYSRGMALDACNPLLPANRAMALLKQDKFAAAEADCLTALTLDPLYTKAHLRLGSARFGLRKYTQAKETFEKVLLLEPQNKKAKLEIEKIEKEILKEKMVSQVQPVTCPDAGLVMPISKPPHERSKKRMRRIHIEEVGLEEDLERQSAIHKVKEEQSDVKKTITARDDVMFEKFTSSSPSSINEQSSFTKPESTSSDKDNKKVMIEELTNGTSELSLNLSEKVKKEKGTSSKSQKTADSPSGSPRGSDGGSESVSPRSLQTPQTSFQFQSDYKSLKNDLEKFYDYVKAIDPSNYLKLFGEALDAEILLKMLIVFQQYFLRDGIMVYPHLCQLSGVKRFDMTVMFFSRKEQQVIKDLLDTVKKEGHASDADVEKLRKKYQVS
ncbi:RNA polymerase II-associated protein 3-like [Mizuhopecten yessoensis]|uniref:RNA polymerase II-associated protein 3 n=1 Tax=Mizuhopecten yessoensis TaxID=6573 RepID=A0A210Q0R0_MIZYE|nr:RNA polymerase II-associated protein 3-like [Mizuhopecten yessoensis]OWF42333.1 RNA polymerase II-associated protein 3 [Mizuhopecten yessoensis]